MKPMTKYLTLLTVVLGILILTGCNSTRTHSNSSAVQFLYPDKERMVESPSIPRLELPLDVAIAFVPENRVYEQTLTELEKVKLMKEVSDSFREYEFVKSIEVIPSAYLKQKGSFSNLDQIRTMYGVDVIALVSYDQTQFTDEDFRSIAYWTLIGAYLIRGEKNDTHTMVDATVYDIQSRKMLFRAPGIAHVKSKATPVNLSEQLRQDSTKSFNIASKDLIKNLDAQLQMFKQKVKDLPEEYQVVHKEGYTGGGSLDGFFVLFLSLLCGYWMWTRRKFQA